MQLTHQTLTASQTEQETAPPSRVSVQSPRFFLIGAGKAHNLPSLRTVLAVLPHTALQSAVSNSGRTLGDFQ